MKMMKSNTFRQQHFGYRGPHSMCCCGKTGSRLAELPKEFTLKKNNLHRSSAKQWSQDKACS